MERASDRESPCPRLSPCSLLVSCPPFSRLCSPARTGASAKPELPVHFYMKGSPGTKCDASRRLPFEVVRQSSAGPLWAPGFAMQTHMCHFFASAGQSLPTRLHVPLFHELSPPCGSVCRSSHFLGHADLWQQVSSPESAFFFSGAPSGGKASNRTLFRRPPGPSWHQPPAGSPRCWRRPPDCNPGRIPRRPPRSWYKWCS